MKKYGNIRIRQLLSSIPMMKAVRLIQLNCITHGMNQIAMELGSAQRQERHGIKFTDKAARGLLE